MNELEVKTVNDLKAYVNKLREFKTYCTAGAILICTQKISEDLDEKLTTLLKVMHKRLSTGTMMPCVHVKTLDNT